ncbi:MAG: radical SAM protein [Candidatus Hodarchaeota archaeon]
MTKAYISESKAQTYYIKRKGIPKGCQQCLRGEKAVLFLNGLCQNPEHCWWYCPISKKRKGKDFTYINEIRITNNSQLLDEINKTNAKGISLTGGDPLFKPNVEKTLEYIKFLKFNKGKRFHIHLYTNGIGFSERMANKLANAGLDEIRFNPSKENWSVIKYALKKKMNVGAEVPIIPLNEYIKHIEDFIFYLDKIGADFINLNEFEYCFPNSEYLKERGFKLKKGTIASVENSKEMAINLIKRIADKVHIKIHFCTIIAKDYWQLKERYMRRAKEIKEPYEDINEEGLLMYAQIEGNRNHLIELNDFLLKEFKIPKKYLSFNNQATKLPITVALDEKFLELIDSKQLEGYILEITPFREDNYCQVTEKTPLKVFKEEIDLYDS